MVKRNTNDSKIIEMKKLIESKKAALKAIGKFTPATNCSLAFDDVRYNLHTLTVNEAILIASKLQSLKTAAAELGFPLFINSYSVDAWIGDLKSKILILDQKNEEMRLKLLEDKLTALLSAEKKTELLIEDLLKELP